MSSRRGVGLLLAAALLLRLASNWWLTVPAPGIDADAAWYHSSALSIAAGEGYVHHFTRLPTAAWPPGYPAILASMYLLFGPDPALAYLLNAIAGTLTCWLAGRIAFEVTSSARAQLVATALAAFTPSHVLFASLVMSETVYTTMMTGLVLTAIVLVRRSASVVPWLWWFTWGVGVGLASLVRAEAVVLLAAPAVVLAVSRVRLAAVAAVSLVALAGVVVAELPWLARNAALFGRVVPVSTSFGRTFLIGHNPAAGGDMNDWSPDSAADQRDLSRGGPALELEVDNRLRDAGMRFMLENPGRELQLVFRRFYAMYRGDRVWGEWYDPGDRTDVTPAVVERLGRLGTLYYWILLALAAPAFIAALRNRDRAGLLIALTILFWTAFFVVVLYGSQRFHFPLLPLFGVFAASTLAGANPAFRSRLSKPRSRTFAVE